MRKFKKTIALMLSAVTAFSAVSVLGGCGKNKEGIVDDGKTINVRVYAAGYGDEYFKTWARAFEDIYYEEGYKINIVESSTSIVATNVTNELVMGDKNGIDLYYAGSVNTQSIIKLNVQEGFDLTADLTDVMDSYPINSNGEEETVKIKDKLRAGWEEAYLMDTDYSEWTKWNNKWLSMPVLESISGLIANKKVLADYNLEIPQTTNDLENCFAVIKAKTESTKVYPTVFAGDNAYNYLQVLWVSWLAQYMGVEEFHKFVNLDGVTDKQAIIDYYEKNDGLKYAIDQMQMMVNSSDGNCDPETATMMHGPAQHELLTGKAAFMSNGNWLQNEMVKNYPDQIQNMVMIRTPVLSELGIKLALDGKEGKDAEKCETVLKKIITGIDAGKDDATIKGEITDVALTDAQIARVREARGVFESGGMSSSFLVNSTSDVLDIVKKFLRFTASDDAIKILYDSVGAASAYAPNDASIFKASNRPFVESVNAITSVDYAEGVSISPKPGSYRTQLVLAVLNNTKWGGQVDWIKTMSGMRGELSAQMIIDEEVSVLKEKLN